MTMGQRDEGVQPHIDTPGKQGKVKAIEFLETDYSDIFLISIIRYFLRNIKILGMCIWEKTVLIKSRSNENKEK